MNLPMEWLRAYTDIKADPQDFSHRMTMTGSKVESYVQEADTVTNVVAGKIVSKKHHDNADTLWVCSVFDGSQNIQIVTGAQNVSEGDMVPVALDGALLPDGKEIKSGELRGEKSEGMLCSLAELGLTTHDFPDCIEDGIMILPADTKPGTPIADVVGLNDVIFEFEITPNRPDCQGILGLVREAAVTYNVPFNQDIPALKKTHGDVNTFLTVENQTPNCLRYTGAIVENVRVKPSPLWMRQRLRRCGVRPINNIVDITNYVMLEYNQPMHAFDHRYVAGEVMIIRQAQKGEAIVTLDGVERNLTPNMMVIADAEKPIALAGVMGGEYSGIMDDTTTIVLESACFNAANVRATARAQGMRTEASSRFEKGLNPYNTELAVTRALQLIEELDAGDIVTGLIDVKRELPVSPTIRLEPDRINHYLGTDDIPRDFMVKTLTQLGCTVKGDDVTPPHFRADITGFVDLCEEVARIYGYDKIPVTVMSGVATARPTERQRFDRQVAQLCVAGGLYEINSSSFMGKKDLDLLQVAADSPLRKAVVIRNPLGEDTAMMRTTALTGMLSTLARNYSARIPSAGLFELTREFLLTGKELPDERRKLILGSYGQGDFYMLKGIVDMLTHQFHIDNVEYNRATGNPIFHPGRSAELSVQGTSFGLVGEIMPTVAQEYGIRDRVYVADIDMDLLFSLRGGTVKFQPLPKFPAISRDLALVCDADVPSAAIETVIRESCGAILDELSVFDVYTGEHMQSGKKSIAYSLTLRDSAKTLTDEDADAAITRALSALKPLDIELRR